MKTKLDQLKDYMAAGNTRAALKLAASWGRRGLGGGAHADAITQGWSALTSPQFYRDLGKDPAALAAAGVAAICEKYGIK